MRVWHPLQLTWTSCVVDCYSKRFHCSRQAANDISGASKPLDNLASLVTLLQSGSSTTLDMDTARATLVALANKLLRETRVDDLPDVKRKFEAVRKILDVVLALQALTEMTAGTEIRGRQVEIEEEVLQLVDDLASRMAEVKLYLSLCVSLLYEYLACRRLTATNRISCRRFRCRP